MKKYLAIILTLAMVLILCACARTEPPETTTEPVPSSGVTTEPATEPATEPSQTTVPEKPEAAFNGYVYLYEDERDRAWEKDVVYFAQLYLGEYVVKGHPVLTARLVSVFDLDDRVTQRYFYDADLRDTFISEIGGLISRIPELTDHEITYELKRIVALIGDAHSSVYGAYDELFPFAVEMMENDGELGLYVIRIPNTQQQLIYSRLVSVNGIPVEEVIQRLSAYVSTENEYWAMTRIGSIFNDLMIADKYALQAAGIVGVDEDSAVFAFEKDTGEIVELEMEALDLTSGEYWQISFAENTPIAIDMFSYSQYRDSNYFYEYMEKYDTLYIRLYNISEVAEYRLEDMLLEIDQELRVIGTVEKIVVDVRDNPGGYTGFVDNMVEFLDEADAEHIYILTDNGSFSAATIFPDRARVKLDNVTIVGGPTAQPLNFFAGASSFQLKNHDVYFTISTTFFEDDPEFEGAALMPDITVYQTLTDYIQGIDTVLQTVLDME